MQWEVVPPVQFFSFATWTRSWAPGNTMWRKNKNNKQPGPICSLASVCNCKLVWADPLYCTLRKRNKKDNKEKGTEKEKENKEKRGYRVYIGKNALHKELYIIYNNNISLYICCILYMSVYMYIYIYIHNKILIYTLMEIYRKYIG